jgi:hypothetical protein
MLLTFVRGESHGGGLVARRGYFEVMHARCDLDSVPLGRVRLDFTVENHAQVADCAASCGDIDHDTRDEALGLVEPAPAVPMHGDGAYVAPTMGEAIACLD